MREWEIEVFEKLLADLKGNELTTEEKIIDAQIKIEELLDSQKRRKNRKKS